MISIQTGECRRLCEVQDGCRAVSAIKLSDGRFECRITVHLLNFVGIAPAENSNIFFNFFCKFS